MLQSVSGEMIDELGRACVVKSIFESECKEVVLVLCGNARTRCDMSADIKISCFSFFLQETIEEMTRNSIVWGKFQRIIYHKIVSLINFLLVLGC